MGYFHHMIDQSLLFFTDIDDFVLFILRKEIELDWKFATGVVYNTFLKIQQYPEACNYSIVRILSRLLAVTKKVMLFIVNDAPLFDELVINDLIDCSCREKSCKTWSYLRVW